MTASITLPAITVLALAVATVLACVYQSAAMYRLGKIVGREIGHTECGDAWDIGYRTGYTQAFTDWQTKGTLELFTPPPTPIVQEDRAERITD